MHVSSSSYKPSEDVTEGLQATKIFVLIIPHLYWDLGFRSNKKISKVFDKTEEEPSENVRPMSECSKECSECTRVLTFEHLYQELSIAESKLDKLKSVDPRFALIPPGLAFRV